MRSATVHSSVTGGSVSGSPASTPAPRTARCRAGPARRRWRPGTGRSPRPATGGPRAAISARVSGTGATLVQARSRSRSRHERPMSRVVSISAVVGRIDQIIQLQQQILDPASLAGSSAASASRPCPRAPRSPRARRHRHWDLHRLRQPAGQRAGRRRLHRIGRRVPEHRHRRCRRRRQQYTN